MAKYRKGNSVVMSNEAIENYGEGWDGVKLIVTHVATKYMPASRFYAMGQPNGYHPGYDEAASGMGLYDLEKAEDGEELGFSLYDWELQRG